MARERGRSWHALLVLGLLLITYGSVVAVVVGPDESIEIGTHVPPTPARGLALVTHPEITAFRDVDMEVTASAPAGVFLAAARRVDTVDLLAERERYEISRMFFGDVGGRMVEGTAPARYASLRPDRIVGWAHVAPASTGASSMVVPLGDDPVDVVAFPVSPDDVVTLTLGVHAERAFTLHVLLVGAGTVLVVVWWLLRRRTRRRARRVAAASAAAALALGTTGCAVPGALPATSTPPVRIAITADEATQVLGQEPQAVHAVSFESYPMWAVVQLPPRNDRRRAQYVVLTRSGFAARWRRAGVVDLSATPPPPGNPYGVTLRATREAAFAASGDVAAFWTTGARSSTLRGDDSTRRARAKLMRSAVGEPWVLGGDRKDVRVVPVVGGHLALVSHTLHAPAARRLTTAVMLREGRRAEVLGSTLGSPTRSAAAP